MGNSSEALSPLFRIMSDGAPDGHTPNRAPWYAAHFKLKESERQQVREGLSDLPPFTHSTLLPDTGHNSLMIEVPSLYPEERSIFISRDGGTLGRIGTNRPCSVAPSLLPLVHTPLSYHFPKTLHSSSNLAINVQV